MDNPAIFTTPNPEFRKSTLPPYLSIILQFQLTNLIIVKRVSVAGFESGKSKKSYEYRMQDSCSSHNIIFPPESGGNVINILIFQFKFYRLFHFDDFYVIKPGGA